jgi:hypothetical protein
MLRYQKDSAVFRCALSAARAVAAEIQQLTLAAAMMEHDITDKM